MHTLHQTRPHSSAKHTFSVLMESAKVCVCHARPVVPERVGNVVSIPVMIQVPCDLKAEISCVSPQAE